MDTTQIEKTVKEIIVKRLPKTNPAAIQGDAELDKLGMDSLAASWILADMEEAFGFNMPGPENCILKTVANAVDYVDKNLPR
ncbi:acyl carrier protein [Anaeroselena agilis]|uniref:Acyl carrier protein n=1 Tax=Anaeroselena agilis TaxID=3063788 RepID=A0ABU3P155_9FIRM|nr:acyl carrier protein [Selenomonadales bacterium 4137-cl]